mmetsp:Transcript_64879/g.135959  ORF Transcript_64879/g.135959 Transcript_64879/m.135959 type:complete len:87 (+) Transcript_64879:597-857(+)
MLDGGSVTHLLFDRLGMNSIAGEEAPLPVPSSDPSLSGSELTAPKSGSESGVKGRLGDRVLVLPILRLDCILGSSIVRETTRGTLG